MARIKQTDPSEVFNRLHADSRAQGEDNDCTVKAISVVTGVSYEEAHAALKAAGRKDGRGTHRINQVHALASLGYKMVRIPTRSIIEAYPGVHRNLQSVTTHHPERFSDAWADMPPCLLYSNRHVSAFRDGELHDWAKGRALRCYEVMRVVKIEEDAE